MEMPTRDSRSVSTLRAMLALCTITFTATGAPFHEPASSGSTAQHALAASTRPDTPHIRWHAMPEVNDACRFKTSTKGCQGRFHGRHEQLCLPAYLDGTVQYDPRMTHGLWRTFVDPAEGPGAYQVPKLEVGKVSLLRAAAPRAGGGSRAQPRNRAIRGCGAAPGVSELQLSLQGPSGLLGTSAEQHARHACSVQTAWGTWQQRSG